MSDLMAYEAVATHIDPHPSASSPSQPTQYPGPPPTARLPMGNAAPTQRGQDIRPRSGTAPSFIPIGMRPVIIRSFITTPARRVSRRGTAAIDTLLTMAREQDLLGPLGVEYLPADESPLFSELVNACTSRAYRATDIPRLRTALPWFGSFLLQTKRVPFIPAYGTDRVKGQIYNRCTLDAFTEYLRRATPRGKSMRGHLAADTIDGYVSAIRLFRSREARYEIADPKESMIGELLRKEFRRGDGVKERPRSLGIRAYHLRLAAENGFPRDGTSNAVRWAAATAALNLVLRGGEVGVCDTADIDLSRIITWKSIEWKQPTKEIWNAGRPWMIIRVVPIKDTFGKGKAYPCPVSRQHTGKFGSDPVDPYDAVAWAWWIRSRPGVPFPTDKRGRPRANWNTSAPIPAPVENDVLPVDREAFFSHPSGEPFCTGQVAALGKAIALYSGVDPTEVGGKCFRIGGATDWRAGSRNTEASGRVLRQRGRWAKDMGEIYARPLVAEQLHYAAKVGAVSTVDLEAHCADLAQRAIR